MAYSEEFREAAVAAAQSGVRQVDVARLFNLGVATVGRWVRRARETGSVKKRPSPGRVPVIPNQDLERLRELVFASPQCYRSEFVDMWYAETGVLVSNATMGRALRRAGFSKKRPQRKRAKETNLKSS